MLLNSAENNLNEDAKTNLLLGNQAKIALALELLALTLNTLAVPFYGFAIALITLYSEITRDFSPFTNSAMISDGVAIGSFLIAIAGIVLGHVSLRSGKTRHSELSFAIIAIAVGYLHVSIFLLRLLITFLAVVGQLKG